MTDMLRLRVAWTGSAVVGGGLSTFYFDSGSTATAITPAMNTFFGVLKAYVPGTNTFNIPNGGDIIHAETGALSGIWSSGGAYTISCTGSGPYPSGVGGRIKWGTAAIINGRRVRGATAVSPMVIAEYDSDGTLNGSMLTAINNACAALLATTGVELVIWHRPHPKGAGNGASALATSGTMQDAVSWLRTRRT